MSVAQRVSILADDAFRQKQLYDIHKDTAGLHSQLANNYTNIGDKKSADYHKTRQLHHEQEAAKHKPKKTAEQLRQDRMR